VSDPTYRIDVEHDPSDRAFPWKARVWRISDDQIVAARVGDTAEQVTTLARETVYEMTHLQAAPFTVYVDDDGQPVEAHSVKA